MDDETLEGFKDLDDKLAKLGVKIAGKVLRQSTSRAMQKVLVQARKRAPVGKKEHKTYKGRLVAPGFLSRNIKKVTMMDKKTGSAVTFIGVSREAFYGVQFIHQGFTHKRSGKKIEGIPWLSDVFEEMQEGVIGTLKSELSQRIDKISEGGK